MPDSNSTRGRIRSEVAENPATDRLKEELRLYLTARAEDAVTRLGERLGESVARLAEPGRAKGGVARSLAKGGQALSEGKSPARAALTAGTSAFKDTLKTKAKGLFGSGRRSGGGASKSVTIVEDIDVGVPVRDAYDQWTQFQEFSTFAKGVVSVETTDDTTTNWKVKVAKSTRSWQANVTEQIPDERITWTTEGAKGTVKGVVTFHRLTDDLTRVLLVLEYFPKGLFEKTGNIWRAQGRRARLDLKLYRKFLMMRGEATDGWRGEIKGGEVVVGHDEAIEQEESRAEGQTEDVAEPDADEDLPEPHEEYGEEDSEGLVDDEGADELYDEPEGEPEYEDESEDEEGYDDEADGEAHEAEAEPGDDADEVEAVDEAEQDDDAEEGSRRTARRSRRRSATVGS
ncbi:SRPBCC family protein [Streptomyces sp. NPDC046316]|uniref:SRPBCC family protein n=1 Tax=Streptomyces sp. NPDC046316 TaxID=3154494 RepID=UPI0033DE9494